MVALEVSVTMKSPLHVGAGAQRGTFARRPLLKTVGGWPYVPASALKGRWRHAVEQTAAALADTEVCHTHHDMCRQQPCAVCRLFGSPWQAGAVRFTALHLSGPEAVVALRDDPAQRVKWPKTTARTGVAINRRRGVAQDDFLFDTELFLPGTPLVFSGTMHGDITRKQAGLLVAGLNLLPALGGGSSRGLGWLETTVAASADGEPWPVETLAAAWAKEAADE